MPNLNVSVPHNLSTDEATSRIKNLLRQALEQYGQSVKDLQEQWRDNGGDFSFEVMGFKVNGAFDVQPRAVEVTGDLPLAASMFKGRIESAIKERLASLLA